MQSPLPPSPPAHIRRLQVKGRTFKSRGTGPMALPLTHPGVAGGTGGPVPPCSQEPKSPGLPGAASELGGRSYWAGTDHPLP